MRRFLKLLWLIAVISIGLRGILDTFHIIKSIRWLSKAVHFKPEQSSYSNHTPYIAVFIPVLREQRVIKQTMQYFAKIKYPLDNFNICIITTEKEIAQRIKIKEKLAPFAIDIMAKSLSKAKLIEKYLGTFSENVLEEVITTARNFDNQTQLLEFLQQTYDAYPTTIDIVKEQVSILNKQLNHPLFVHIHYPEIIGGANHQYHYAQHQLSRQLAEKKIPFSSAYIAVFNADSQPNPSTFPYVNTMCEEYFKQHHVYPPALQQGTMYDKNIDAFKATSTGLFLQAAAIYQDRWVLSHEIPWRINQVRSAHRYQQGKLTLFERCMGAEYSLCVAHGLFVRWDVVENLELFATDSVGDDILWTFSLCGTHTPILPIPLLEAVESATTLTELTKQKRSWFMGYTEAPQNRRIVRKKIKVNNVTSALLSFHEYLDAAQWLLGAPIILLSFVLPIFLGSGLMFLISSLSYALYGFATYGTVLSKRRMLRDLCNGTWRLPSTQRAFGILFFSLPIFLHNCIGPWWCLINRFKWAITGTKPFGEKTER